MKGLQGDRLDSNQTIVATLKHFAAYGVLEGGRNAASSSYGLT